jgi:23S rRNA (adenine2503-C2)-methyltransferase
MSEAAAIGSGKTNLLGLSREKMEQFLVGIGEKPFRAQQILKWIHHSGVDNFDAMTNIGKVLRARLHEIALIRTVKI